MIGIIQEVVVEKVKEFTTEKIVEAIKIIFLGQENYNSISEKYKQKISISDLMFIKKVFYFNKGYGTLEEKIEFKSRYSDDEWQDKIEKLLFAIDGMNDLKKIEATGKIFRLFLFEILSLEEYLECLHIIDMMQYEELLKLKVMDKQKEIEGILHRHKIPILLHKASAFGIVRPEGTHGNTYLVTEIGKKLFNEEIL